jgi:hypothetical protein
MAGGTLTRTAGAYPKLNTLPVNARLTQVSGLL